MILCLIGFSLTACGTTRTKVNVPIIEYEVRDLTQDRYVKIDGELTTPVKIIKPKKPDTDTIDIIIALQLQQKETRFCNSKLMEIGNISNTELNNKE